MKNTLAVLALCAAPLLAQAQAQNCTGDNADAEYILNGSSAMHWPTGLVWRRCSEGQTFDGGQCTGTPTPKGWLGWASTERLLPQPFADQKNWNIGADVNDDWLQSGGWRMAYASELQRLATGCVDGPKVNPTVFPGTPPSWVWSASFPPYKPFVIRAWAVSFQDGSATALSRDSYDFPTRLVRGGQPFADLAAPAAQNAVAGAEATFPAFLLHPSAGAGQALGGARIEGAGNPRFQVNGRDWVQEAIVKSGDEITVRITAGATGDRTATFTLHSARTTGTQAAGFGNETSALVAHSASFTVTAAITARAEPAEAGRVVCTPGLVPAGGSVTCQALSNAYRLAGWEGDCAGQDGPVCTLHNVTGAHTVTARFDMHAPIPRLLNDTGITESPACGPGGPATQDCHHGRDAGAATGQLAKQGASSDARNGFDFTKVSHSGGDLPADAPLGSGAGDWACTRDNLTGLVWEVKTASGLRGQDHLYTWFDPASPDGDPGERGTGPDPLCETPGRCDTAAFVEDVNAAALCGARDWRLPTVQELEGLLDMGRTAPGDIAIDPAYFPHTPPMPFWTSTPYAGGGQPRSAWFVDFDPGTCGACALDRVLPLSVRLVRGAR